MKAKAGLSDRFFERDKFNTMKKKTPGSPAQERIDHSVYGLGTIVEVNDRHTTIDFDEAGIKKFMTSMVEFSASSAPLPAKPVKKKKKKPSKSTPSPINGKD